MGGESKRADGGRVPGPPASSHTAAGRDAAPRTPGLTPEGTGDRPVHTGYRLGSTDPLRWLISRLAAVFRTKMDLEMPQATSHVGDKGARLEDGRTTEHGPGLALARRPHTRNPVSARYTRGPILLFKKHFFFSL